MTEEQKWNMVIENNLSGDGLFFYGVKTTGIFCRPSCKSKSPLRKNVMFFTTKEQAQNLGFRPCKRCRPDLRCYHPEQETAVQVKEMLNQYYKDDQFLLSGLEVKGFSRTHLSLVFKKQFGLSLYEYINYLKIEEAKQQLIQSTKNISEIAFEAGFHSLASFYRSFQRYLGISPASYRKGQLLEEE